MIEYILLSVWYNNTQHRQYETIDLTNQVQYYQSMNNNMTL